MASSAPTSAGNGWNCIMSSRAASRAQRAAQNNVEGSCESGNQIPPSLMLVKARAATLGNTGNNGNTPRRRWRRARFLKYDGASR